MDGTDYVRIVYLLGILVLIAPAAYMVARDRSVFARNLAIWLGVAAAAALAWVLLGRG